MPLYSDVCKHQYLENFAAGYCSQLYNMFGTGSEANNTDLLWTYFMKSIMNMVLLKMFIVLTLSS
jgi:hypothetical protein